MHVPASCLGRSPFSCEIRPDDAKRVGLSFLLGVKIFGIALMRLLAVALFFSLLVGSIVGAAFLGAHLSAIEIRFIINVACCAIVVAAGVIAAYLLKMAYPILQSYQTQDYLETLKEFQSIV